MVELMVGPSDLPETPYTYRLAVNPLTGDHGYDVGRWPAGADLNDPTQFEVAEHVYGQSDAAARAVALNAAGGAPRKKAKTADEDDNEVEVTRTTHTTVRRK